MFDPGEQLAERAHWSL